MIRQLTLTAVALAAGFASAAQVSDTNSTSAAPLPITGDLQAAPDSERLSLGQIRILKRLAWGHPNELFRLYALEAVHMGRDSLAAVYFERAALYADKFSQHRLSLLYWHGKGVARDRVKAYVWADLAAERGYRGLLLIREKMWSELSQSERNQVAAAGAGMYARFSDAVSKPRLERRLHYGLVHATGSRTGSSIDRIRMLERKYAGADIIPGNFYARERWYPKEYWKAENSQWGGYVEVQPLISAKDETPRQDP